MFTLSVFKPIDDKEWIRRAPGPFKYVMYALLRLAYRAFPNVMQMKMGAALVAALQLALVALISLAPVIYQKIIAPTFGIQTASPQSPVANPWWQGAFLLVLQIGKFTIDKLKISKADAAEKMRNLQELAVSLDIALHAVEGKITEFASDQASQIEVSSFIQHALKCIEATVRLCVGTLDDRYCCVTLMTYEANDRIKIRARSRIERNVGRILARSETMADLVARYCVDWGVVHNFRLAAFFRKKGAVKYRSLSSAEKPKYQSILFLPLPAVSVPGQNRVRKGVVCIDAARPFEFLGREIDILVRVQAYLSLINMMLISHGVGVEPELDP